MIQTDEFFQLEIELMPIPVQAMTECGLTMASIINQRIVNAWKRACAHHNLDSCAADSQALEQRRLTALFDDVATQDAFAATLARELDKGERLTFEPKRAGTILTLAPPRQ